MKRLTSVQRLLNKSKMKTKIYVYFSSKTAGEDYDPYEKNYTDTFKNPQVIKAHVTDLTPESIPWRTQGKHEVGVKMVICDKKYTNWFIYASKIVIDNDEYIVYKDSSGSKSTIIERPFNLIRVILVKK